MKTNSSEQPALTENAAGVGKPTHKELRERAIELAMLNGRSAQDVSKSDWEQAKRDLAVEPDPKGIAHESVSESEGWDPVPGSTGHQVHVPSGDDEDDEGRSDPERLVEKGVEDAGREQMREADREAEKNE